MPEYETLGVEEEHGEEFEGGYDGVFKLDGETDGWDEALDMERFDLDWSDLDFLESYSESIVAGHDITPAPDVCAKLVIKLVSAFRNLHKDARYMLDDFKYLETQGQPFGTVTDDEKSLLMAVLGLVRDFGIEEIGIQVPQAAFDAKYPQGVAPFVGEDGIDGLV